LIVGWIDGLSCAFPASNPFVALLPSHSLIAAFSASSDGDGWMDLACVVDGDWFGSCLWSTVRTIVVRFCFIPSWLSQILSLFVFSFSVWLLFLLVLGAFCCCLPVAVAHSSGVHCRFHTTGKFLFLAVLLPFAPHHISHSILPAFFLVFDCCFIGVCLLGLLGSLSLCLLSLSSVRRQVVGFAPFAPFLLRFSLLLLPVPHGFHGLIVNSAFFFCCLVGGWADWFMDGQIGFASMFFGKLCYCRSIQVRECGLQYSIYID
jgi:hypothetical protein